jgi:pimeloyl-ACP methyl ester carboxylesterase
MLAVMLTSTGTASAVSVSRAAPADRPPALTDAHPCPGQTGFTCSTLRVPLDHREPGRGTLSLHVAASDNTGAPRGVLFFFAGGPGQAGVPLVSRLASRMPEVARDYRIVTLDQRGTGERGGVNCPRLQDEVGSSDIARPSDAAVAECAGIIGGRRDVYTTEQSVADYDLLRRTLGVRKVAVDGASYGSFSAARYAVANPGHVSRVVLDSVLPHVSTPDVPLYLSGLHAQARVLRTSCRALPDCSWDPAADLAWLVRHGYDDVTLFDTVVTYEFIDTNYAALIRAMHQARAGRRADLDALVVETLKLNSADYRAYSSGLHAATFCSDSRFPWGDSAAPVEARRGALERAIRRLPESRVWPYRPATAEGNGFLQTCLKWPVTRPGKAVGRRLPDVPVLLINGDRDLSTPMEWAYQEAAYVPRHRIVIVKGADHSIQMYESEGEGRRAVTDFLLH